MTDFYSDFRGVGAKGLTAEQYFYVQVFNAFAENTKNGTLPFFDKALDKMPRELSTGKIINNENTIALEQIASKNGYKSNLWIYGDELNKLQKEVGDLYYKRGAEPVVCLTKYFGSTHLNETDFYVSEGGSGKKEQYLYNLDSLDERSRAKVMKYYEQANSIDQKYTETNFKAFMQNKNLSKQGMTAPLTAARERARAQSIQGGMDLNAITGCHWMHTLGNAIGQTSAAMKQVEAFRKPCIEAAQKLVQKVSGGELNPQEAGKMLCTALNAGTEYQRISVAKGFNLENAKKVEELKVAENNRNKVYKRSQSSGWER